MIRRFCASLSLALPLVFAIAMAPAAETFSGKVLAVPAGDVIIVLHNGMGRNVRLYGIDAPDQGQAFSDKAQAFLTEKTKDQEVTVEVVGKDSTGTTVGKVTLAEGGSLGDALLGEGLAWWDQKNAPEAKSYRTMNAKSIVAKQGIWSDAVPLAPWDYRSSNSADQITYEKAEEAPAAPAPAPKKEEPIKLEAKGNASSFGIDWNGDLDPMSLMAAYPPSFPKDANGKVIGVTVPNISSIPYAGKYGFQDGDIVTGVNGVKVNTDNIAGLLALVPQFQNTKSFNVSVIRNGQPVSINVTP